MLPVDVALLHDPEFRAAVEHYAADEEAFFADFAFAFGKVSKEVETVRDSNKTGEGVKGAREGGRDDIFVLCSF